MTVQEVMSAVKLVMSQNSALYIHYCYRPLILKVICVYQISPFLMNLSVPIVLQHHRHRQNFTTEGVAVQPMSLVSADTCCHS